MGKIEIYFVLCAETTEQSVLVHKSTLKGRKSKAIHFPSGKWNVRSFLWSHYKPARPYYLVTYCIYEEHSSSY